MKAERSWVLWEGGGGEQIRQGLIGSCEAFRGYSVSGERPLKGTMNTDCGARADTGTSQEVITATRYERVQLDQAGKGCADALGRGMRGRKMSNSDSEIMT